MEKEFVPYELALRMKALGFDEPCFGYWSTKYISSYEILEPKLFISENVQESALIRKREISCLAFTYSQAFDWFREKHALFQVIDFNVQKEVYFRETSLGYSIDYIDSKAKAENSLAFKKAQLASLTKLIEIVESK
jgi:hypothetical protein